VVCQKRFYLSSRRTPFARHRNRVKKKAGGARPGAGRKPKLSTQVRKRALEEKNGDAEAALDLIILWMYDETLSVKIRKECADDVMDRVWGKPTQKQENKNLDVEIKVSYTNDWRVIQDVIEGEMIDAGVHELIEEE